MPFASTRPTAPAAMDCDVSLRKLRMQEGEFGARKRPSIRPRSRRCEEDVAYQEYSDTPSRLAIKAV